MRQARQAAALRRQQAQRRGRLAEWICLWYLRLHGWRIVARGWRCPSGEIDIVAQRGKMLAIIEVKSRGEIAAAAAALVPRQDAGSSAPPKHSWSCDPISPGSTSDST